jgi:hypothetical protein
MMQVSKKIPWEDSQTLFLVRAAYILSNVIIISVYAYTHLKINQKKGEFIHFLSRTQCSRYQEMKLTYQSQT